jgi:hypothetical protein
LMLCMGKGFFQVISNFVNGIILLICNLINHIIVID